MNNTKKKSAKAERLITKKHFKNLDGVNFWNNNNENIIIYIKEEKNIDLFLDVLLKMPNYKNWFMCMTISFNIEMINKFINAGYVILSQKIYISKKNYTSEIKYKKTRSYLSAIFLCALIYDSYPVLFLSNLKEPKITLKKFNNYELKVDIDFDKIIDKCSEIHGESWLTKPLRDCFKKIHKMYKKINLISFGVYKNNELKAGEFGIISGKMYVSYTGYYEESSAGTIQMIKMFKYLKNNGIICCNLFGPGYAYKYKFGTIDIDREKYIKLFREMKNKI
jgi:Leu/Phe-tRNA-protein transferase